MAYMWLKGVPVALLLAFISIEITLFSAGTVPCDTRTPGCEKAKVLQIAYIAGIRNCGSHDEQLSVISARCCY